MSDRAKKKPSDYGQMNFRVPKGEVDGLNAYVEKVQRLYNNKLSDDERLHTKGEIMEKALVMGLNQMIKAKGKK